MELISKNIQTLVYIESETEFNRAKAKGFWDVMMSRITKRNPHLFSFAEVVGDTLSGCYADLGVQDIELKQVVGSVARSQDFTRHFWPCTKNKEAKERWRGIYTLAVTGAGFPPVEVYQVGNEYFVEDGHHRISVAKYLGWDTIQAQVIVLTPVSACRATIEQKLDLSGRLFT